MRDPNRGSMSVATLIQRMWERGEVRGHFSGAGGREWDALAIGKIGAIPPKAQQAQQA